MIILNMEKEYRYSLDNRRGANFIHICPNCGKREFKRYIDNTTMEYIAEDVGKCNRLIKCSFHKPPKVHFQEHPEEKTKRNELYRKKRKPKSPININEKDYDIIDEKYVKISMWNKRYINTFTIWLFKLIGNNPHYGIEVIKDVVQKYDLGGSHRINGAVVFWQRDYNNQIRTGKIMLYNQQTGKRIKDENRPNMINWVHYYLKKEHRLKADFKLKQCFYGEHLLKKYPNAIVAVFESEKTAIVASIIFPDLVCIASGGLGGLNLQKCKVLAHRHVIFFPDLGCYQQWKAKVEGISKHIFFASYSINDVLEDNATEEERAGGLDLCDYIIKSLTNNN